MHDGGLYVRAVLRGRRYVGRKFPAVRLPARTNRFEKLVFGDLMAQGRNVEYLPCLDDNCIRQRTAAGVAALRRRMGFNVIDFRHLLQGVTGVPLLAACRLLARLALRFRLGAIQPIRGRWFDGVAAVLRQATFKFGDLSRQRLNLRRQRFHLCEQRTNQFIFGGNAQSVKVRQFIHVLSYRLPLPSLKPGIAMLFRPTE